MSKPGLRVYTKADRLPRVLGGLGVAVLSTSQGLMTDREARKRRVGGEVLCLRLVGADMSRIGKTPIPVPCGVDVTIAGRDITVKGPKGTLDARRSPAPSPSARTDGDAPRRAPDDERQNRALHGLTRSLVNNMVVGVTEGFRKDLEIVGVGYRATAQGPTQARARARLQPPGPGRGPRGHHLRGRRRPPASSVQRHRQGDRSARSRPTSASIRKPEPYKGKGVRYAGEHVQRKAGKAGK